MDHMPPSNGNQNIERALDKIARALEGNPLQQQAWQSITPTSGTVTTATSYMKDSMGFVHLRGQVNVTGLVAFITLPAGYRPEQAKEYATSIGGAFGVIGISTAGVITKLAGGNGNVDLDAIIFQAGN